MSLRLGTSATSPGVHAHWSKTNLRVRRVTVAYLYSDAGRLRATIGTTPEVELGPFARRCDAKRAVETAVSKWFREHGTMVAGYGRSGPIGLGHTCPEPLRMGCRRRCLRVRGR